MKKIQNKSMVKEVLYPNIKLSIIFSLYCISLTTKLFQNSIIAFHKIIYITTFASTLCEISYNLTRPLMLYAFIHVLPRRPLLSQNRLRSISVTLLVARKAWPHLRWKLSLMEWSALSASKMQNLIMHLKVISLSL